MKATMKAAGAAFPVGDDWAFEVKWDGHRTIAHIEQHAVRFQTTGGNDSTQRWRDVSGIAAAVGTDAILDGEMVVLDSDGRPSFDLTQKRTDPTEHPAIFQVFDVLQVGDQDATSLPYRDRRALLEQLVEPGSNWKVPAFRVGGGEELLAATAEQGLEGVIAKRLDSPYQPGKRSKDWLKLKNRRRVELAVGGFTAGSGNRAGSFGSLLVGIDEAAASDPEVARALTHPLEPGALRFAGGVGTGFDTTALARLVTALESLSSRECPFDGVLPSTVGRTARWVEPTMRVEVELAEFTNGGHARHASFVRVCDP
ncbi:MAG: non-homologous end-joining DNA ligase [Ilumatobacter sp.]